MPRVKGPLFSMEASGSLKKTIIYSHLRHRPYVKSHTVPNNPKTVKQVNMRKALALVIEEWQSETDPYQDDFVQFGKQFNLTGTNIYMQRALDQYIIQLGTSTTPASVDVSGKPPNDVWVWT